MNIKQEKTSAKQGLQFKAIYNIVLILHYYKGDLLWQRERSSLLLKKRLLKRNISKKRSRLISACLFLLRFFYFYLRFMEHNPAFLAVKTAKNGLVMRFLKFLKIFKIFLKKVLTSCP